MGEVSAREPVPNPGHPDHNQKHRILLRLGNRDLLGFDFKWIDEDDIVKRESPGDVFFVERREYGPLVATPVAVKEGEKVLAPDTGVRAEDASRPRGEGRAGPRRSREDREARDRRHQLPNRAGAPGEPKARLPGPRGPRPRPRGRARPGRSRRSRSRRPSSRRRRTSCRRPWRRRPPHSSPSRRRTAARRSYGPSTSTAPTRPTSWGGSAGSRSTRDVSGSSSAPGPASRTPRAASFPPSSAP